MLFDQGGASRDQQRQGRSAATEGLPPDAVRNQLDKIFSSQAFGNSPQLCRFLRFVADQEIGGQGDQLKEYLVGVEVFRKDQSFDPRLDTVVRTEARRLRRKLTEYYQTEGLTDTIEIDLPKGSYRPVFRARPGMPQARVGRSAGLRSRGRFLAAGVFLAVAGVATYWLSTRATEPGPGHRSLHSIAVLPLENLSADPEQEYFSDGMTDALITDLAKLNSLRVISRTSVLQYKRVKRPLPEIARQLGVDYVVEGTVLGAGERVRINAQLIAVRNEHLLWADIYERDRGDALALQGELARAIARQISIHVTPQEQARLGSRSISPEAQDDYLKGRFNWHTRDQDRLMKSVEYFQRAIAKEPGYALAYAGLSDSYSVLSGRTTGPDRKDLLERARGAAKKAIALDDSLGEAHAGLAVSSWDWTWQEDEREFRRAIELSPGYATAHQWYAGLLTECGRVEEGLAEARRAVELDPLSPSVNQTLGWALYMARQYDRAIQQFQHAIEAFPDFTQSYASLGLAYEAKGMHREAIAVLETLMKLTGGAPPAAALLAHAHAGEGDRSEARRRLDEFKKRKDVTPILFALLSVDVGDKTGAFEWFAKGVEQRSMFIDEVKVEPMYDSLHSDPRFATLLKKMNLAN
ncbi:MAG: tetratricopeptide repeat protein [Acidobacteriia bacterium]|nr:tetratricopeptide repeat protein [Terriglobia bacterium]